MNSLDSWRGFLRHVKTQEFIFGRGEAPPWTPYQGFALDPQGADPRPNMLFSKTTLLYHFIMKNLHISGCHGNKKKKQKNVIFENLLL